MSRCVGGVIDVTDALTFAVDDTGLPKTRDLTNY